MARTLETEIPEEHWHHPLYWAGFRSSLSDLEEHGGWKVSLKHSVKRTLGRMYIGQSRIYIQHETNAMLGRVTPVEMNVWHLDFMLTKKFVGRTLPKVTTLDVTKEDIPALFDVIAELQKGYTYRKPKTIQEIAKEVAEEYPDLITFLRAA